MRLKLSILCAFMALFATPTWAQTDNTTDDDNGSSSTENPDGGSEENPDGDSEDNPDDEPVDQTSVLLMPNAFSPNGDGINDIYKPKDGYKNISEFHAYIYNRWGQKLYDWSDPSTGWDGTFHGKPVKDGVYFCLVKATGADGKKYNIKRDVNLLRGYIESQTNSGE